MKPVPSQYNHTNSFQKKNASNNYCYFKYTLVIILATMEIMQTKLLMNFMWHMSSTLTTIETMQSLYHWMICNTYFLWYNYHICVN